MDKDLDTFSRPELLAEVQKLRAAIRAHRDASGHDLCWFHPKLWSLLPEQATAAPASVPDWPQFMHGCVKYRTSLDIQCPNAPRSDEAF